MIEITIKNAHGFANKKVALERLRTALSPQGIDPIVERVALKTHRSLVEGTQRSIGVAVKWPHPRWRLAMPENQWKVEKPNPGKRVVINRNEVMAHLEYGTANDGQGYIRPKNKKFLFIPLTQRAAAIGTYQKGMEWGVDYILKKQVRGSQGKHVVRDQTPKTQAMLRAEVLRYLIELRRQLLGNTGSMSIGAQTT